MSDKTAQAWSNGFRVYYNYIRPHTGLDGLTPAQASGLNLPLEQNKWLSLIKMSNQPQIEASTNVQQG